MIRRATENDAEACCSIYNEYVLNSTITFETESIETIEMKKRILQALSTHIWLVYEEDHQILGYAYASSWKTRSAYQHTVETTIYLSKAHLGKKIGTTLYQSLLQYIASSKYKTVIAGIALPNDKSVRLHEKLGFEKVAHFHAVGYKHGRWIDVGNWQLKQKEL